MNKYRDPNRLYEITDVMPSHIWYSKQSHYDIRGTIVRPIASEEIGWTVVKQGPSGFPSLSRVSMSLYGLRLRPLTQKEMEKFNASPTEDRPTDRQEAVAS